MVSDRIYFTSKIAVIPFFHSSAAIPHRLEVLRQDLLVQAERERELQTQFQHLQDKCFEASLAAP